MKKITLPVYSNLIFLLLVLLSTLGWAQSQRFTTNGTFTVPAGITSITVEAWGGGGKGSSLTTNVGGGGGGGGAYAKKVIATTPGTVYTVTVGAGSTTTAAGGDSWFGSSTTVLAKGGNSAADNSNVGANGGAGAPTSIGDLGYVFAGGKGANGVTGSYGGGGGSSAGNSAGINASSATGATAPSNGGNGGNGRSASQGNGSVAAVQLGGGGGGALRTTSGTRVGGAGSTGQVLVRWNAPEINLVGNTNNIVDGDTTPSTTDFTDFSTVAVTRTFTIQNTGSIDLTISNVSLTGANASEFSILTMPSATIAAGSSSVVVVKFNPTTIGLKTAQLNIDSNDSDESTYNFALQATGVQATMSIKGNSNVIADGDVSPINLDWTDFGSTNIFSPITRTYTIFNLGNFDLNLTGAPIVSITGSDFSISSQPTTTVIGGMATTSFTVSFNPSTIGFKTADISIANSDAGAGKNPYNFRISGTGIQAFPDTDFDEVFDNVDLDDDNDGIPDSIELSNSTVYGTSLSTQVYMLNETFGAGTTRARINVDVPTASTTYCYEDGTTAMAADECDATTDLNDGQYTICNTAQIASWAATHWHTGPDHTPGDTNGRMALFNATNDITDEFYRTDVQGVIMNVPLTYSFWILNLDRTNAPGIATRNRPNITVEFRDMSNNLISTIATDDIAPTTAGNTAGDWYQFSATFTPLTSDFTIIFKNNQPGGAGNDLALDDIQIVQTLPDFDQDGVADVFDLDSDNDGIGDIIEDRWQEYTEGYDTMDIAGGNWIDANNNGWLDAAEAYYNENMPKDFDGDLVANYVDLDSDNDALFDVDEAGIYNGDGDVDCDGVGDGADDDGDGILDAFDTLNGFANSGKALPENTSVIGEPNFLNVQSNSLTTDISSSLYASLDGNDDGIIFGTADNDKDGIIDTFDTDPTVFGSPRDLDRKLFLHFDGRNDYGQATGVLGGLNEASIMAWIDLDSSFANEGVIVGQDKFQLQITSAKKLAVIVNGYTLSYNLPLNTAQWYHVAAVYGNGQLQLFLNGHLVNSTALTGSIVTDSTPLTIGKSPNALARFFNGKIDEVRIFKSALSVTQLQRMVYQEINDFGGEVRGEIVPKDIEVLPFTNLLRYYRMDVYKDDIIDDLTTSGTDMGTGMQIFNNKIIAAQQAPMPFVTKQDGDFATAVNDTTNDVRGLDIDEQDWSIVHVQHNITATGNNVDLGMIVDPGVQIVMNNDSKIQNDWYLKLDGSIDLQGKSQLVQSAKSDLDVSSAGLVQRDQAGQSNGFNYNYWSSPVGVSNTTSNNNDYTLSSVMRDGTDANNPQPLNWTSGLNGAPTAPITLSSYWIFKFQNVTPLYANWQAVGTTGTLSAGQGFTLKGSNALSATQNYTFEGKPNNGTITSPIAAGNLNLSGNPYPSAIDADLFISQNLGATNGTLYFWEHYSTNNTHNLAEYQGGYATRTLVGGVPPVSPSGISGLGSSSRTPGRFIPVGQGFFVSANATGGNIEFNNSQRAFVKEDNANSNILFRQAATVSSTNTNNAEDAYTETAFEKIRLGFNSNNNFHRELLMGFMNENATSGIDAGYDAVCMDNLPNDMYFINEDAKLVIAGESYFDQHASYPLRIKTSSEGPVSIVLDGTENFNAEQPIYIYDAATSVYYDIRNENVSVNLTAGETNDRFFLKFNKGGALANPDFETNASVQVSYASGNNQIIVHNTTATSKIETVTVFNIVGQSVASWTVNSNDTKIELNAPQLSTGTYIVRTKTNQGVSSKKILIP
jgi:hypothetical protein